MNPQCGAMRQLDRVIYLDLEAGQTLGIKHIAEDEFWVPLHIPGRPLMPGVLMIEALAQISSVYHHVKSSREGQTKTRFLGFTRVDETAFRGQVVPGDDLYLLSKEVSFSARRFVSRGQAVVNGRLVCEALITGMTL